MARNSSATPSTRISAQPYDWPHDGTLSPRTTALVVIDMQNDCQSLRFTSLDRQMLNAQHAHPPQSARKRGTSHIWGTPSRGPAPPSRTSRGCSRRSARTVTPSTTRARDTVRTCLRSRRASCSARATLRLGSGLGTKGLWVDCSSEANAGTISYRSCTPSRQNRSSTSLDDRHSRTRISSCC